MTEDDIEAIQRELEIELPDSYKDVVRAYPVPAFSGNADTLVWDNAKRIIEYNRELREGAPGGVKPWPVTMFATGHGGDGCPTALDLSDGGAVWWVDHCHLDNETSYKEADSFAPWADKYFADLREDLLSDDVDPDGTPDERMLETQSSDKMIYGCLTVALLVLLAYIVMRILEA